MATAVSNAFGLTGIAQIDALAQGAAWTFPGARTLTYSFSINDTPSGGTWSAYPLIAHAVTQAIQAWASVINVSFVESGSGTIFTASGADIAVTLTGNELTQALGAIGLGIIPDPAFATLVETGAGYTRLQYPNPEGDVFYDNYSPFFSSVNPGTIAFSAIAHELGHALGLKHPHDDGGNSRPTFAALGISSQDNRNWTIMGYDAVSNASGLLPLGPMILDVQALQRIYGANLSHRTGNDVYVLGSENGIRAIWDAGGADTISAEGSNQNARIDLREAGFSYLSFNIQPHYTIAYGVTIENATGGTGNDELLGNSADNVLTGGAGIDTFDGGGGNDLLIGGEGADTYRFGYGAGQDTIRDFQSSASVDAVSMTSPLLPGNLTVSRHGTNIVLRITGTGDQLTLENFEASATRNIAVMFGNGTTWDGTYLSANANDAPAINATDAAVAHHQSVLVSGLFGVSDAEGNAITQYEFWDGGTANGSGYFTLSGSIQVAGAAIPVTAANLGNARYVGGTGPGSETVWVRAFDGIDWSPWASWVMNTTGSAPSVSAPDRGVHPGQSVAASSLFTVSDVDGDLPAQYEFWDGGTAAGSGRFLLGGIAQGEGVAIPVSPSQLGQLQYAGGTVNGSEIVWARASDATGFGPWASWTMTTGNQTPVITPASANRTLHVGQSIAANSLFTVSDADGDAIMQYRFWDEGTAGSSGYFSLGGQRQIEGAGFTIAAADLPNLQWVSASQSGSEVVWVRATDGFDFGPWVSWTMTAGNSLPMATPTTATITSFRGQSIAATALFSAADADGDTISTYRFWDEGTSTASGYFSLNGHRQIEGAGFDVAAADLVNLQWVGGATGSEMVWVRASDGFGFGPWAFWTMASLNRAPVATASDASIAWGQSVAASSLFSVADADGDIPAAYDFWDGGEAGGYFSVNGIRQGARQSIVIGAADLPGMRYVGGASPGTETLWVRVNDGSAWSEWRAWLMTTSGSAPVASATSRAVHAGQALVASSLFSVSDIDGDLMARYQFWDEGAAQSSGYFSVAGVRQAAGQAIVVEAADLANARYVGGQADGPETVWVRAHDGSGYGPWTSWVMTTGNRIPEVSAANKLVLFDHYWPATDLFAVTDADADAMTEYEFWDGSAGASSGYFTIDGIVQAAERSLPLIAPRLSQVSYVAGTTLGSELLWVRAYDGEQWSAWRSWTVETVAQLPPGSGSGSFTVSISNTVPSISITSGIQEPPVVTPIPATLAERHPIAAAGLFSVSDAENDAITQYEFEALSGSFKLDGVIQSAGIVSISAAQLSQLVYLAPQAPGSIASVRIRAFDATDWSLWATTPVTVVPNHAPEITINRTSASRTEVVPFSSLLSTSDAESDPLESFEVYDARTASVSGHFSLNGVALGAGQIHSVAGASAPQAAYVGGSTADSERLWIRASDGYTWSAWQPWIMSTQNAPPQVSSADATVQLNQSVALASLFSATDPDGDLIQRYEVYDEGTAASSGRFSLAGSVQPAATQVSVEAGLLGQAAYTGGTLAGTEKLWVRAYDGASWSSWSSWMMTTTT